MTARESRGFALILTLSLLALLVLAVYGLGVLTRVGSQTAISSSRQETARQNALLGLEQAVGALQQWAGRDDCATAMAGIAGEPAGSQRRHWCGVWASSGAFLGWLTSGATTSATPSLGSFPIVQLIAQKSVGNTSSADNEFVDAGKIPLMISDASGVSIKLGSYAYWVGDEGVKMSAWVPNGSLPQPGLLIGAPSTPANINRMVGAFQLFDTTNAAKVIAYAQATNLAYAAGKKLTASNLQDSFHHVTLTHWKVAPDGSRLLAGAINMNTTSNVVWRSILESYETVGATHFGTSTKRTSAINAIANGIAATSSGKFANGPFPNVDAFLGSALLSSAVTGATGISVADFSAVMRPMLVSRSDTFRVRAYGEALNPLDASKIEATAFCEAIVQRTLASAADGRGRKFVVTYFRWLSGNDI
ncbi:MAG TPA: hypothetical protein VG710_08405 [Opitutus sp.]|nr:hypothetical protein [Opitutus sp.]